MPSGSGFAADIGVPPSPPPPASVYNWTGWYVGGNAGVGLGTYKTDFNVAPSTFTASFPGVFCPGPSICEGTFSAAIPGFAGRDEVYPGGFIGGGQIGFNWQLSPLWVVGAEADFQGADEKEHSTLTQAFSSSAVCSFGTCTATGSTNLDFATKIEWFGTARLRAGYLFGDGAVLTYVTGGLAYGKVDVGGTSTVSGAISSAGVTGLPGFSITHAIGHSHVNTGWVVGSGTEGRLAGMPGWTYRIEGLYMDLGHLDDTDTPVTCGRMACTATATGGQTFTHTHFTDTILRAGLNYHF